MAADKKGNKWFSVNSLKEFIDDVPEDKLSIDESEEEINKIQKQLAQKKLKFKH